MGGMSLSLSMEAPLTSPGATFIWTEGLDWGAETSGLPSLLSAGCSSLRWSLRESGIPELLLQTDSGPGGMGGIVLIPVGSPVSSTSTSGTVISGSHLMFSAQCLSLYSAICPLLNCHSTSFIWARGVMSCLLAACTSSGSAIAGPLPPLPFPIPLPFCLGLLVEMGCNRGQHI